MGKYQVPNLLERGSIDRGLGTTFTVVIGRLFKSLAALAVNFDFSKYTILLQ